jgi:hypothetical protein
MAARAASADARVGGADEACCSLQVDEGQQRSEPVMTGGQGGARRAATGTARARAPPLPSLRGNAWSWKKKLTRGVYASAS